MTEKSALYRNHRAPWTLRELNFVEKHYGSMKTAAIAEYLGRSPVSVASAAHKLRPPGKITEPWTEAEKEIVRTYYAKGSDHVLARLPGRTRNAVHWMAKQLGAVSGRNWNRKEVSLLKQHYPVRGTAVADLLPGRTPEAVKIKACETGITFRGGSEGKQQMWSEAELQCLEKNAHLTPSALLALFPYRTRSSVQHARERLRKKQARRMTPENNDPEAGLFSQSQMDVIFT